MQVTIFTCKRVLRREFLSGFLNPWMKNHSLTPRKSPLLLLFLSLAYCGGKQDSNNKTENRLTATELVFTSAAEKHSIPLRFLLAIAQMDSHFNPNKSTALYDRVPRGPETQETAFGLSRTSLNIENQPDGDNLSLQVFAYANWLEKQIEKLGLPKDPQTAYEKFSWIWALAQSHRQTATAQPNLQALFGGRILLLALFYIF
jgi:hypothetical protein